MSHPLTDQPMLETMPLQSHFLRIQLWLVLFNIGSSSGGTDVIAAIFKKYYEQSTIGRALLYGQIWHCFFFIFYHCRFSLFLNIKNRVLYSFAWELSISLYL